MQRTLATGDIDTSAPDYRKVWLRARDWPMYRLTSRARELASRKALGHASHAEAVELRALAAVYGQRRAGLAGLQPGRVEDASASELAGHLDRLAALTEAADPRTFIDQSLLRAAVRLAGALGAQLLAAEYIRAVAQDMGALLA